MLLLIGALFSLHVAAEADVGVPIAARLTVAKTFVVDTTSDAPDAALNGICATASGVCSLRAAITEANINPGHDTINFNIPGTGVQTINIGATLPLVSDTDGLTVDGYTQPGSVVNTSEFADNAQILIEVAGDETINQDGFFVTSPHNLFKGLSLDKLRRSFWFYGPGASDNTVVGSFIGTNPSGTYGAPVAVAGASGAVMQKGATDNHIGTPGLENRNVISGNSHQGVATYDNGTERNVIQNNIVGLNPAGTARLGNRSHGVDINTWSADTLVGGTGPGERNVISGNYQTAVEISHNVGTLRNKVIGNWIGTAPDGQTAPSYANNLQFNVRLEGKDSCDSVCPPDQGFSEVRWNVLANSTGGVLVDKGTHDAVIANNLIGLLPNGTPAGAAVFGVRVEKGALNNTVGPGNVIAYNAVGISAESPGINPASPIPVPTYGEKFTQNSVHDNLGLGIDLEPFGAVNQNDPGDADEGVNHLLNYPEFATPTSSALVSGTACGGCTVEVFLADGPANAFGEGKTFLTSAVANGAGAWTALLPPSAAGNVITATATDAGNNTSEFAVNRNVPLPNPLNLPPVAVFTASCTFEVCSFDGSASFDPDGSVVAYAWDFGDGATGVGVAPSHTFAATQIYGVTLTVTDNNSATGFVTLPVTVNLLPPSIEALDDFNRTVSPGWGSALFGGTYANPIGEAPFFNVSGGVGHMTLPTAGVSRTAWLGSISKADVDVLATVATDRQPSGTGYGQTFSLVGRRVAAKTQYNGRVRFGADGSVVVAITSLNGTSTETVLGGLESVVPGLTYAVGQRYRIHLQISGTNPTTLSLRVWPDGQREPSTWNITRTDSTPWLQAPGNVGVTAYMSASSTNAPVTFSVDDLLASVPVVALGGGALSAPPPEKEVEPLFARLFAQ